MNLLKQSTAVTIKLGPFIDNSDGKTEETALTISQADIRLSKNGGDIAQTNNSAGATHDELGYYNVPLDATDTNTLGRLLVAVHESGALPVWQEFLVVTANVYDTLCSTDTLDVNVTALANDVITAATFDESTAFPLKSADTGTSAVARVGADSDTLETLSDQLDTAQADLDNPAQYKADVSGIPAAVWGYATRTLSTFGTLISDIWAHATRTLSAFGFTVATNSDANVTAIKAKTDNLPASPAPANEYDARMTAIQTDLDNPSQYKADVSGLAQEATLTAIKGSGWTNETLKAIRDALITAQADLDNTDQYKANVSGLATASALSTISGLVDDLETRLTAVRAGYLDKLNVTGILANSSDANTYKADVSGLATASALTTVDNEVGVIDGIVDAIKLKTDNLPATPAPAGEYDAELAAIQTDLDNPSQYKADVSGLATTAHMQEVEDKVDTVDTAADAIKAKTDQLTFSVPNKVDATATVDPTGIATSEELELIGEKVDGVLDKLNVSSVEFVTAVVGSTITILRGDTLTASLLNLGSMESYVSLDFTVKASKAQADADSLIRIRLNASGSDDGLLILNGAVPSNASDGSITITDAAAGDITITLAASCTDDLAAGTYAYDVQLIEAGEVSTLTSGKATVIADVTRAVA